MKSETLILTALLLPLIGVVGILITRHWQNLREASTLITAVLLLLVVVMLLMKVLSGNQPQLEVLEMLPGLTIKFTVEPLGILFALIAAVLWPINTLYSIGYMRGNNEDNQTRFYIFFAVAIFGAVGVAFAGNLLTLFIFYEVLTLSTFPLVAHKGNEAALKGGRVYLGTLLATSIGLLLPAIIWTWMITGTTDFSAGGILLGKIDGISITILAALFLFGIGKAAVMPVHKWLPAAMVAPTPVSALLHAVAVVKAGVFSVIKIVVYIFGIDFLRTAPNIEILLWVACFTVVAASVVALYQDNLKKRLAYSTIGQLAYVVVGAMLLAPFSIIGASLHLAIHAFGKITLFFAAGAIYTSSKKTEISQLAGIGKRMPITMAAFSIGAISMIGLPPAAGFISKWYLISGAWQADQIVVIVVFTVSTLLNAAYFLPIIFAAYFQHDHSDTILEYGEAPAPAVIALSITAVVTLILFLFPNYLLNLVAQIPL